MYVQPSWNGLEANIGKVFKSKTGKTLLYKDVSLQSLKGAGFKTNYYDIDTDEEYWVSACRKDGNDGLYMTTVYVDEDIRSEYWTKIRQMPEQKNKISFRSRGKHRVGRNDLKNKVGNI